MSILIDQDTRLVVQGITGKEGSFHAEQMIEYGTAVVAGVTPGKGGTTHLDRPVYNTVSEAVEKEGANVSVIFVPPPFAADAILEAADAGVDTVVCITEGIPVQDMIPVKPYVDKKGVRLVGPNCPGLLTPGASVKVGIMPTMIFTPGNVGVVSRSGTLTYEAVDQLTRAGLGQTTAIGIGGDPIIGTQFIDAIRLFNDDPETEAIVMIGEIGGSGRGGGRRVREGERARSRSSASSPAAPPRPAAAWATPAPSSPAARGRPRPSSRRCRRPASRPSRARPPSARRSRPTSRQ